MSWPLPASESKVDGIRAWRLSLFPLILLLWTRQHFAQSGVYDLILAAKCPLQIALARGGPLCIFILFGRSLFAAQEHAIPQCPICDVFRA
jgi:hypothetical protein